MTAGKNQLESSLNNSKALSDVAKNQQTDPLEVLDNIKGFIDTLAQQDTKKADEFKSAVMLLASPNSIALSTNEDIHLSADGQISHTSGDSINLSTQKSLIGHASAKISLFAAQEGAKLFAGKGKVEIQAQGDGLDLIARKGIQIISTEDAVYIISPKEIRLVGETSEVKLNGSGVFSTTGGLFEVKSGQHKFVSGQKVVTTLPNMPNSNLEGFNQGFNLISDEQIKNLPFKLFNSKRSYQFNANLDEEQQTQFVQTGNEAEKLELKYSGDDDVNHQWKEE